MEEKRKFMRFRISFPFKSGPRQSHPELKGTVKNISMEGLGIVLDKSLKFLADSLANLDLFLPHATLKVSAEVIWKRDYEDRTEAGVRFVDIDDNYKQDIYDYIFKHHQEELTQGWWQM